MQCGPEEETAFGERADLYDAVKLFESAMVPPFVPSYDVAPFSFYIFTALLQEKSRTGRAATRQRRVSREARRGK
jgi:hypothetical protein